MAATRKKTRSPVVPIYQQSTGGAAATGAAPRSGRGASPSRPSAPVAEPAARKFRLVDLDTGASVDLAAETAVAAAPDGVTAVDKVRDLGLQFDVTWRAADARVRQTKITKEYVGRLVAGRRVLFPVGRDGAWHVGETRGASSGASPSPAPAPAVPSGGPSAPPIGSVPAPAPTETRSGFGRVMDAIGSVLRPVAANVPPAGVPLELYDESARVVATTDGLNAVAMPAPADMDADQPAYLTGVTQKQGNATLYGVEYASRGQSVSAFIPAAVPLGRLVGRRVLVRIHETGRDGKPDMATPSRNSRGRVMLHAMLVRAVGSAAVAPAPSPSAPPPAAPPAAAPRAGEALFEAVNYVTGVEVDLAQAAPAVRVPTDADLRQPFDFVREAEDGSWQIRYTGTDGQERSAVLPLTTAMKLLRADGVPALAFQRVRTPVGSGAQLLLVRASDADLAAIERQRVAQRVRNTPAIPGLGDPGVGGRLPELDPGRTQPNLRGALRLWDMGDKVAPRGPADSAFVGVPAPEDTAIHTTTGEIIHLNFNQVVVGMPSDIDDKVPAVLEQIDLGQKVGLVRYQSAAGKTRRAAMATADFGSMPPGQPFLATQGRRTGGATGERILEPMRRPTRAESALAPRNAVSDRMAAGMRGGRAPEPVLPPLLGTRPGAAPARNASRNTLVSPGPSIPLGIAQMPVDDAAATQRNLGDAARAARAAVGQTNPRLSMPANAVAGGEMLEPRVLEPTLAEAYQGRGETFTVKREQMIFSAPSDMDESKVARYHGIAPNGYRVTYTTIGGTPGEAVVTGVTAGEFVARGPTARAKAMLAISGRTPLKIRNARNAANAPQTPERELVAVQF